MSSSNYQWRVAKVFAMLIACTTIFSFTTRFGGEGFEISVNNKVVLQQFGRDIDNVKTLKLDQASPNDEVSIRYHHCGKVGRNRVLTIKDDHDKILKQFHFSDVSEAASKMNCKVKDILGLKGDKNTVLKLFYSSTELPQGRQLAAIPVNGKAVAKL